MQPTFTIVATKLQTAEQIERGCLKSPFLTAMHYLRLGFTVTVYRDGKRTFGPRTWSPDDAR